MKLAEFISYLQQNYLENRSDALEFASVVTGIEYSAIPMNLSMEIELDDSMCKRLERVKSREPLAYIINNKNFYGLDIFVDENVLIPRPETELLVDKALETAKKIGRSDIRILDMCTGSGCIMAALLSNLPGAYGIGVDISISALDVAAVNMKNLGLKDRCELVHDNVLRLDTLQLGSFDIITCNPPYLSDDEWEQSDKSLKYEPKTALSTGGDPLLFYKKLLDMAPELCNKNGGVLFEIGLGQYDLLRESGYAEKYSVIKDYQQIERVLSWTNL